MEPPGVGGLFPRHEAVTCWVKHALVLHRRKKNQLFGQGRESEGEGQEGRDWTRHMLLLSGRDTRQPRQINDLSFFIFGVIQEGREANA